MYGIKDFKHKVAEMESNNISYEPIKRMKKRIEQSILSCTELWHNLYLGGNNLYILM